MSSLKENLTYIQPVDELEDDKFLSRLHENPDSNKGGTLHHINGKVSNNILQNITDGDIYSQIDEVYREVNLNDDIHIVEVDGAASVMAGNIQ